MTLGDRTEYGGSRVDLFGKVVEVGAAEFPLEGLGDGLVVLLEAKQTVLDLNERGEIVWRQSFALDEGEVDLDLVEPTGVERAVDEHKIGESRLEASDGRLAAVRGAIVHDPKDVARIAVGSGSHDLRDEAVEGLDAGSFLATAEDLWAVYLERSHIGPGATASILVFDRCSLSGARGREGCLRMRAGMLVFSSALITNSSDFRALPSHWRA